MLHEQSKGDKYEACKVANSHALSVASCFQALSLMGLVRPAWDLLQKF